MKKGRVGDKIRKGGREERIKKGKREIGEIQLQKGEK